eukprot:TRINITY_DN2386_c0_g1_i1.p1 TRINITY_DN2386_c0_g1~~TRINITY_DN2386_c0_g1_i1.p1  ORF type:complete len:597 (-),score=89.39 TRINITY_DN2386_c0_g1_i1:1095-2837(-)
MPTSLLFDSIEVASMECISEEEFDLAILWNNNDGMQQFRISIIPIIYLQEIKQCLDSESVQNFSREGKFRWRHALLHYRSNPIKFQEDGGWDTLFNNRDKEFDGHFCEDEEDDDEDYIPPMCNSACSSSSGSNSDSLSAECEDCLHNTAGEIAGMMPKDACSAKHFTANYRDQKDGFSDVLQMFDAQEERFIYRCGEVATSIMYNNIKYAFYLHDESSKPFDLLHFQLNQSAVFWNKATWDVPIFVQKMKTGDDGLNFQNTIDFTQFIQKLKHIWSRDLRYQHLQLQQVYKELNFSGVVSNSGEHRLIMCTDFAIISLVQMPFLVILRSDIQLVNLEGVGAARAKFDMVVIFKDYQRPPLTLINISMESLDTVKQILRLEHSLIPFYETPMNLNWKHIMQTINKDKKAFLQEGGWDFLNSSGETGNLYLQDWSAGKKSDVSLEDDKDLSGEPVIKQGGDDLEDSSDEDYVPPPSNEDLEDDDEIYSRYLDSIEHSSEEDRDVWKQENIEHSSEEDRHAWEQVTDYMEEPLDETDLDENEGSCERWCIFPLCCKWVVCYCKLFFYSYKDLQARLRLRKGKF